MEVPQSFNGTFVVVVTAPLFAPSRLTIDAVQTAHIFRTVILVRVTTSRQGERRRVSFSANEEEEEAPRIDPSNDDPVSSLTNCIPSILL